MKNGRKNNSAFGGTTNKTLIVFLMCKNQESDIIVAFWGHKGHIISIFSIKNYLTDA